MGVAIEDVYQSGPETIERDIGDIDKADGEKDMFGRNVIQWSEGKRVA